MLEFEHFPFWIGMREPDDGLALPSHLPFRLDVDAKAAIPRVVLSPEIVAAVDAAYAIGSMLSTPLGTSALATDRMNEMLDGLQAALRGPVTGKFFLEIGCGRGHLLNEIKSRGGVVMGCEIGPQGMEAEREFSIPVSAEPLRPGLFEEPFDCIYSYGFLEHAVDLAGIMEAARSCLKPGGLFFHSVPNADDIFEYRRIGDLCHEHVNYFTAENGCRLLAAQGFGGATAKPTKPGNDLHLWGYLDVDPEPMWPGEDASVVEKERTKLRTFSKSCMTGLARQIEVIEAMIGRGESVGFYAGGYVLGSMVAGGQGIQYFDGDAAKHGKCWLAGQSAVRDPKTLLVDPVDNLIINAESYYAAILENLVERIGIPPKISIIKLSDLS